MKTKLINRVYPFALIATLSACGGGGGGSSSSTEVLYTGSREAASLETTIQAAAYIEFYQESQGEWDLLDFFEVTPDQTTASVKTSAANSKSLAATESAQGSCGGSATVTDNSTENQIDYSLNANNFCDEDIDGDRYEANGELSLSGTFDPYNVAMFADNFTINYPFFEINASIDGDISIQVIEAITSTFSEQITTKDNNSGKTLMRENWFEEYDLDSGTLDLSGRVFHPQQGFVDLRTVSLLEVDSSSLYPVAGEVILLANDSQAWITFYSGGYLVEVDVNNDNIVDFSDDFFY